MAKFWKSIIKRLLNTLYTVHCTLYASAWYPRLECRCPSSWSACRSVWPEVKENWCQLVSTISIYHIHMYINILITKLILSQILCHVNVALLNCPILLIARLESGKVYGTPGICKCIGIAKEWLNKTETIVDALLIRKYCRKILQNCLPKHNCKSR